MRHMGSMRAQERRHVYIVSDRIGSRIKGHVNYRRSGSREQTYIYDEHRHRRMAKVRGRSIAMDSGPYRPCIGLQSSVDYWRIIYVPVISNGYIDCLCPTFVEERDSGINRAWRYGSSHPRFSTFASRKKCRVTLSVR